MIPAKFVDDYRKAITAVSGQATKELNKLWLAIQGFDGDELLDFLRLSMPNLVAKYGDVAAAASAQFYEQVRAYQVGGNYNAQLADNYSDKMEIMMGGAGLIAKNKNDVLPYLVGLTDKYVKQAGRDTIWQNGIHDPMKPRYARVPSGTKTCAFCLMLAGRGFVYYSKQDAGDIGAIFNRYHDFCDCSVVVDFSDDPGLEGYDSSKYEDMYYKSVVYDDRSRVDLTETLKNMRRKYYDELKDGVKPKQL